MSEFVALCGKLYELFVKEDCSMLEVNPLVITGDNDVICLDAKVNFDDNASFRHPEWDALPRSERGGAHRDGGEAKRASRT
jgi:succinyl-CoA synthetase beta subunit